MSRPVRHTALGAGIAVCVLLSTGAAHAGTYSVAACDAAGGVNHSWSPYSSHSALTAYTSCPSGGDEHRGLVARNLGTVARVPYGATASQAFSAPPGASITAVTTSYRTYRTGGFGRWQLGYSTASRFLEGCTAGSSGCVSFTYPNPTVIAVPHAPTVYMGITCADGTGCSTGSDGSELYAQAQAYFVRATVEDFSAPGISPFEGGLFSAGWHRGNEEAWAGYGDNVGIRLIRLRIDGAEVETHDFSTAGWPDSARCDYTYARPCHDIPAGGLHFSTASVGDGAHAMRIEATDAAGNTAVRDSTIAVDNHAPGAPEAIALRGGEGWRANNDFSLAWTNPAGQVAPVAQAFYRLCRADAPDECVEGSQAGEGIASLSGVRVPAPGDYTARVWLADAAGNSVRNYSDPVHLRFDETVPGRAEPLPPGHWLSAAAADAHDQPVHLAEGEPRPPAGIAGYSVTVDGSDPDATIEAPGDPGTARLPALPEGDTRIRARAVSGSGVVSDETGQTVIRVDRHAPDVTVAGAPDPNRWNRGPVSVAFDATDQAGLSGMEGAAIDAPLESGGYISSRVDDGPFVRVRGAQASAVIGADGRHTLTFHATDAAGNGSPDRALPVLVDATPPTARFGPRDLAHPRRVSVDVDDATSGVASGWIELRRPGGRWRRMSARLRERSLSALVPDGDLPAGRYELRALVRDHAGNERIVDRAGDGGPVTLALPLGIRTRLRLVDRRSVGFGRATVLRGTLLDGDGRPLSGLRVRVSSRIRTRRRYASVVTTRTDRRGRFAYRAPAGPSRVLRFAYAGDERRAPARRLVALGVAGRSSLTVDRHRARNGSSVRFTGRLLGARLPAGARTVELQAHYRGSWRTFAVPRLGRGGRWSFPYRFGATVGRVVYAFRVRIQRDSTYPYELGYSRVVRVTVVG